MRKIKKEDLETLKFDGIIVSVPRDIEEGQHNDISFIVECNYYTNGKHGYEEPGAGADESSFYHICHNTSNLPFGLWMNATSRFTIEHIFRFDSYDYYKFDSLTEFCIWYLQRNKYEVWIPSGDLKGKVKEIKPRKETTAEINTYKKVNKEWIHEKCGTNTPPTSVPEHPSKGNKKKLFSEAEEQKIAKITETCLKDLIKDELKEQIQKDKFKELNKINGESIYWDIYCEKETTPEMREKIENIYPEFKEQYAKSYLQYNGNELETVRDIPQEVKDKFNQKPVTGMELPEYILNKEQLNELMNPGHKKRRNKYSDEIELISKIVDYKIQKFILNEKIRKTAWEAFAQPTREELAKIDAEFESWLDKEV